MTTKHKTKITRIGQDVCYLPALVTTSWNSRWAVKHLNSDTRRFSSATKRDSSWVQVKQGEGYKSTECLLSKQQWNYQVWEAVFVVSGGSLEKLIWKYFDL